MNARMLRIGAAIAAVLVASIVIGGTLVFVGVAIYRALADAGSPGLAATCLIVGALLVGTVLLLVGHITLRQAFQWPRSANMPDGGPEQMLARELARLLEGQPTKLVFASLGVGFVLGLSPRMRRAVFRTFVG
jgi:hypothetical protein